MVPQGPARPWNTEILAGLIDDVCDTYRVDEDRVYLTGLSMGGLRQLGTGGGAARAVRGRGARLRGREPGRRDQAPGTADLGVPWMDSPANGTSATMSIGI
jgi:hypothetical protein